MSNPQLKADTALPVNFENKIFLSKKQFISKDTKLLNTQEGIQWKLAIFTGFSLSRFFPKYSCCTSCKNICRCCFVRYV